MVAQSTTEVEFMTANSAGRDIAWLHNLLTKPSMLYIDNNSVIAVAKNPEHFGQLKHIQLHLC